MMQPRIDRSVVLPEPDGPMSKRQFAGNQLDIDALQRNHEPGPVAEFLDDTVGFQNGLMFHRLNTVAGSIFVTFTMADIAEMAHMATVSAKSQKARLGVMTNGRAEVRLA